MSTADNLIPKLDDYAQTLLQSADRIIESPVSKEDTYRLVGHVFLGRLAHELRVLRTLGGTRDAWLIGRSMIEGTMIFDWITFGDDEQRAMSMAGSIAEIPDKILRARRWSAEKAREALKRVEYYKGRNQDPAKNQQFEKWRADCVAALLNDADAILTPDEKAKLERGENISLTQDFSKHLTGEDGMWRVYKYAEALDLMNSSANAFAGYHHWNPLWMCDCKWSDDGKIIVPKSAGPEDFRMAIEIGLVSVWVVAMYLSLCYYPEEVGLLEPLRKAIVDIHTEEYGVYDYAG